jgi:hypothetical protein
MAPDTPLVWGYDMAPDSPQLSGATPMSAAHLYWCLGVGSDVTQSAVQFILYHLSCKLDNGYVKILPPNRIGLLLEINGRLGLRIAANHGGILLHSMSKYSPHLH